MQRAKIKMQNEKLKQIRQAKEQEYGPFASNMERIGKSWSALLGLDFDIPAHDVANMYVAAKLIRTSSCKFKQDTYDDAQNYLHQAEIMHRVQSKSDELYEETVITDANERMQEALRSEHKTNFPKDEPDEQ